MCDFAEDFLFGVLVSCDCAWVRCDDFLDSGCEIRAHTSVRLWFVGDILAHILQELFPFLEPILRLLRRRRCAVGGRYPRGTPLEHHCDDSEDSAVSWVVCIVAVVHTNLR